MTNTENNPPFSLADLLDTEYRRLTKAWDDAETESDKEVLYRLCQSVDAERAKLIVGEAHP